MPCQKKWGGGKVQKSNNTPLSNYSAEYVHIINTYRI